MKTATGSGDLVAVGLLHPDDAGASEVEVLLVVAMPVLRAGRGPLALAVDADGVAIMAGELVWIVTTNKGWAHLRGVASTTTSGAGQLPFRADLFCADSVGDVGPDRMALRLYAPGADPNVASPIHKLHGWMAPGSIHFGRGSAPAT